MQNKLSRRAFLKAAGLASLGTAFPSFFRSWQPLLPAAVGKKNVLIVVFDAFSAYNVSFYGYPRKTTPNIARLADRAIVYHNHFAAGNFSTPGTASLLTGVLPWKHRALQFYGTVAKSYVNKTVFSAFDDYYRLAYSHNPLVTVLLDQFTSDLNDYIPLDQLLITSGGFIDDVFRRDADAATIGWSRILEKEDDGSSYSLFLSELYKQYTDYKVHELLPLFPRGLPVTRFGDPFTLEQAVDWLGGRLEKTPQPFLGYFHFMPPHAPYRTRLDFYDHFQEDGLDWANKPRDVFTQKLDAARLKLLRAYYDEFILYIDDQFQKLMDRLETSGLLKDTWVVLTSDHGELFERGITGHDTPVLYQPVVRVPLLIFEPGRKVRTDIHTPTSAVDLLPTLLHVTGGEKAAWPDGIVMPPFSDPQADPKRDVYVIQARENKPDEPLTRVTVMLLRDKYKLVYFIGYDELGGTEFVQLFDIEADPQELHDLYPAQKVLGDQLLSDLKAKLAEMNQPYL